jgi:basic membrane protein A and related proteins
VKIWDSYSGEELFTLNGHTAAVGGVKFNRDGTMLATSSLDGQVKLWDLTAQKERQSFKLGTGGVYGIDISRDGSRLSAAALDGSIGVWNLGSNPEWLSFPAQMATGRPAFSPDGRQLAMGVSQTGEVKVWNPLNGEELFSLVHGGHTAFVEAVVYSRDGKLLATASLDGTVKLWEADSGRLFRTLTLSGSPVYDLSISSDGQWLAAGSLARAKLWEISSGENIASMEGRAVITALEISPDGGSMAMATNLGFVNLYDLEMWIQTGDGGENPLANIHGHTGMVLDLAFSPDGEYLATAGADGLVRVWEMPRGEEALVLQGHHREVMGVAYSPDGKYIGTSSLDGTLRIWQASSGQEVLSIPGPVDERRYGLAFSPDGKMLATTAGDTVQLYLIDPQDLVTLARGRLVRDFTPQECQIYLQADSCQAFVEDYPPPSHPEAASIENTICMVTETGGIEDSFAFLIYKGVEAVSRRENWSDQIYTPLVELESAYLTENAARSNCRLIILMAWTGGNLIGPMARLHPEQKFLVIDTLIVQNLPQVRGQVYATDQAAFLAGYLAAAMSETGIIGTFGGQHLTPVTNFMDGFVRGVANYNQRNNAQVHVLGWDTVSREGIFVGDFGDMDKGKAIAQEMLALGADVLFPVAGGWIGSAVLQTVADHGGALFIGVDFDYAAGLPHYAKVILTSVEKRLDLSVVRAVDDLERGEFTGGMQIGTLQSGEVGLSPFYGLEARIPQHIIADLEELRARIISGEIKTK